MFLEKISALRLFAALALAVLASSAYACRNDSECFVGDRCAFATGIAEGVCLRVTPNVSVPSDREQLDQTWKDKGDTGYPCQFNVDCMPGKACFKRNSSLGGNCMSRPATS